MTETTPHTAPTITTGIYNIAKLELEAVQAASIHPDLNHACPYPFGSTAASIFEHAFKTEKQRIKEEQIQTECAKRIQAALIDTSQPIVTASSAIPATTARLAA